MPSVRSEITIERLNEEGRHVLPGFLGVIATSVHDGGVRARMDIKPHHLAPNGYLHAASVIALADTTCGYATLTHLPQGASSFTTIELKSNHLGTAREGSLSCEAVAQHLGRNTHVWDAVVTDENSGKKIALFRCTQMILWPK